MSHDSPWTKPTYRLRVWDGEPETCRGYISLCTEKAELVLPLPTQANRPMYYCLDCWVHMADHLTKQGYPFTVTPKAARLIGAHRPQHRVHLR